MPAKAKNVLTDAEIDDFEKEKVICETPDALWEIASDAIEIVKEGHRIQIRWEAMHRVFECES